MGMPGGKRQGTGCDPEAEPAGLAGGWVWVEGKRRAEGQEVRARRGLPGGGDGPVTLSV